MALATRPVLVLTTMLAACGASASVSPDARRAALTASPPADSAAASEVRALESADTEGRSTVGSSPAEEGPGGRPAFEGALGTTATELVVRCATPGGCPPSVGLVVFPGESTDLLGVVRPARCTGTLVAPDRVLTASHCLTGEERGAGAGCEGAWVAFPATASLGAVAAPCAHVEAVDPDLDDDVLLEDWALITLARPVGRPAASIDAAPVAPGTIVTVVSVTPHPIYDTQHALDARLCRVETPDEAAFQLGDDARRVGWLSGCPIVPGHSGSPVLDPSGRLRALVHGGSHPVYGIGVTTTLPRVLALHARP